LDEADLAVDQSGGLPGRVDALIGLGAVGAESEGRSDEDVALAAAIRRDGSELLAAMLWETEPELPDWFTDQMRSTEPEMLLDARRQSDVGGSVV
jgi:hypothetical protein